jgi:hypothetical protein
MGPSQTGINNGATLGNKKLFSTSENSYFGSLETGFMFSRYFGLSSGIGFISYGTKVTLDYYQNTLTTLDSENDSYVLNLSASGIKEIQNVSSVIVPVRIIFRVPFGETIGFFIEPGMNIAIPLNKSFTSSGTFTYEGYYPAYNVTLKNLPGQGFPTDKPNSVSGKLELKQVWTDADLSAGFDFLIRKKIQIAAGFRYTKSLSNISGYKAPENFHLSSNPNVLNSLMGGTSKVTTSSLGLRISFRYYLK